MTSFESLFFIVFEGRSSLLRPDISLTSLKTNRILNLSPEILNDWPCFPSKILKGISPILSTYLLKFLTNQLQGGFF